MSLSYEMFSSARGATYYLSFAGYRIPPNLQGPIPFEMTEKLASFYLARHEDGGRLLWFAKILVESQDGRPWRGAEARRPGSRLFVEADVGSEGFELAQAISYPTTKGRAAYFQVEVGPDGFEGWAELLCRKVVFADFYTYGSNGRLRQRKLVKDDEGYSVWRYDNRGNVVEQSTAVTDGVSPAERELLRSDGTGGTEEQPSRLDDNTVGQVMARLLEGISPDSWPQGLDHVVQRLQREFARQGWHLSEQDVERVLFDELSGRRWWPTDYRAGVASLRRFVEGELRKKGLNPTNFIRGSK